MNGQTQGLFLGLTGAVCLRLGISDDYLRYVNAWMRWPLLATAALLLALGFRLLWRTTASPEHDHGPRSAWLMALPVLAVFVISPPALGAYAAERNAVDVAVNREYDDLGDDPVVVMTVGEFQGRAQWDDTLVGYRVALNGFVTYDKAGNWYVTGLAMSCCAADAVAYRARVRSEEIARPAENTWVRAVGAWVKPASSKIPRLAIPVLATEEITPIEAPANPYE